jgi:hypothetical protein
VSGGGLYLEADPGGDGVSKICQCRLRETAVVVSKYEHIDSQTNDPTELNPVPSDSLRT